MSENSELKTEEIERYIKAGGVFCPYCRTKEVDQASKLWYDEENASVYKEMSCLTCLRDWTDIFKLSNILQVTSSEVR